MNTKIKMETERPRPIICFGKNPLKGFITGILVMTGILIAFGLIVYVIKMI